MLYLLSLPDQSNTGHTWVDDDDFDADDDFEIGGDQNKSNLNKIMANAQAARSKAQHQQSLNVAKQLKSMEGQIASAEPLDKTAHNPMEESKGQRDEDQYYPRKQHGCKCQDCFYCG